MGERILLLPEVAALTRTPEATLRFWRHQGRGPRMFRLGRRVVAYESDVRAWLAAQEAVGSTGGAAA